MSDVLPFKQELSSGTMIESDVPIVQEEDDDDEEEERNSPVKELSGRSGKKSWNLVREKLRSNALATTGNSSVSSPATKGALMHHDAASKSKRKGSDNSSDGVLLYARRSRRQSWAP